MIIRGYRYLLNKEHPNSTSRGYVLEHRLVMEKAIGRVLLSTETVHHIDGNKLNNKLSNLKLIVSTSEHRKLHEKEKLYYLDNYKNEIINYYNKGLSCAKIASIYKTNKCSVLRFMKKHRINLRPRKMATTSSKGYKYCNLCKQHKKHKFFYKSTRSYDGLRSRCIECSKIESSLYYRRSV